MKNNCYNYGPIGERIKRARNARNYTQAELAEMIDINTKNVALTTNTKDASNGEFSVSFGLSSLKGK